MSTENPERMAALAAILGDAPSARLTVSKTHDIERRGGFHGTYKITGFILANENGSRCFVEMSAVRWLSNDEMWWLMHDSDSPITPPKPGPNPAPID